MILSQRIAMLLEEMLEEGGGELSIVRNEFANRLGCVPSQINYVITSRFTPERGYVVESRRGGGGYIRIRKVEMNKREKLLHFYSAISDRLDVESAKFFLRELAEQNILSPREANLVFAALSDGALRGVERTGREMLRAEMFRHVLLQILSESEE